jgi:hypothetical protein
MEMQIARTEVYLRKVKLFFYPIHSIGNLLASFYRCLIIQTARSIYEDNQPVNVLLAQCIENAPQLLWAVEGKYYYWQWLTHFETFLPK